MRCASLAFTERGESLENGQMAVNGVVFLDTVTMNVMMANDRLGSRSGAEKSPVATNCGEDGLPPTIC